MLTWSHCSCCGSESVGLDSVDGMQTPTCCESLLTCLLKGHVIGLQQHLGLDSGLRKREERRD
jgi:hypothetical protein